MRAHIRLQVLRFAVVATALVTAACGGGGGSSGGSADANGYDAGPGPQGGTALYSDFRNGKKLVLHQRDLIAVTPTAFRDRFAAMESTLDAFDGVFLRLPGTGDAVLRNQPVAASAIADDLKPMYALRPTRLKHNFAVVTAQRDFDVFDDPTVLLANVARLAAVARDAGLVGIVIDNENPAGLRVHYPDDVRNQAKTIEEYRAQTQEVSRRMMNAITGAFPDAVVVVLRGPAGAEPRSPINLVNMESDTAPLLGSYFAGFVEGNGPRSLVVDGGTDYGLRTGEQFAASADWRNVQIASDAIGSAFIPESLRPDWPGITTASFGVRELDGAHGNLLPNDPTLWANTLIGALRAADNMVWASFDSVDMTAAAGTNAWVVASRRARAAAATPTGGLGPTALASGTGLLAQYFLTYQETELAQTLVDPQIDFVWSFVGVLHTILGDRFDNLSVIWSGYIEAPVTGTYTIFGTTDDGMRITIGDQLVIDAFFFQAPTEYMGTIDLVAGQRYPITVRYFQGGGESEAHVSWQPPNGVKAAIPTAYLYPYR